MFELPKSKWIWTIENYDKAEPVEVIFKNQFVLENIPKQLSVKVSADTRYKLYVNGKLVEFGPIKGDLEVWFYDVVDLKPYLKVGENSLIAEVLRYPQNSRHANQSLFVTELPGFFLETEKVSGLDEVTIKQIESGEQWMCLVNQNVSFHKENPFDGRLYFFENKFGDIRYEDKNWQKVSVYSIMDVPGNTSPGNLLQRDIPSMKKILKNFKGIAACRTEHINEKDWKSMLKGQGKVTLAANTKTVIEIDAGEEMTGFISLGMAKGALAKIKLIYAECYIKPEKKPGFIPMMQNVEKGDRCDSVHGMIEGFSDEYCVCGKGDVVYEEIFEPFWFRTFRYIRVEIETREEPLILTHFNYRETGYPLEVKTHVVTSDQMMAKIWDISERALKRCMQETYTDCPYYEQLQYLMDTRAQILYTYQTSGDDRLARHAFEDFRRSQRYDGTLCCCYPSTVKSVIPGFNIYYILMIYDHMMYFGDKALVRKSLPVVDGILEYFDSHLEERGLVGKIGSGIMDNSHPYWSFIDWTTQWNPLGGVPNAILNGPLTMESLLYVLGLQYAAYLAEYAGRAGIANEYRARARQVQQSVLTYCVGSNGMLMDGPGIEEYSQHCQVFAILTHTIEKKQARKNLEETLNHKDKYAQCSVAMAYYLFRALEMAGLYERTEECYEPWRKMIAQNVTTTVEDDVNARSDCHAWGALVLYELPAVVLGVRPSKPGYEEIELKPELGYLSFAEGDVITPKGMLHVRCEKNENGSLNVSYLAPEGLKIVEKWQN